MRVPISTAFDPICGTSVHWTVVPPSPTPTLSPSLEAPSVHQTPSGRALGKAKVASTVRYAGVAAVVKQANDTGPGLVDITSANPANPLLPAILAGSKRKMVFGVAAVRVEGDPLGAHSVGGPPCPIVTCGTPTSLPTVGGALNLFYSVSAGMTPDDWARGWIEVASHALVDLLVHQFCPVAPQSDFGDAWLRAEAIKVVVGSLSAPQLIAGAVKSVLIGMSAAWVTSEGPRFALTVGGAGVRVSAQVEVNDDGLTYSSTVSAVGRTRARVRMDHEGSATVEGTGPADLAEALDEVQDALWPLDRGPLAGGGAWL